MAFIIVDPSAPNCPLCDKQMKKAQHMGALFLFCAKCQVSCFASDPFVGRWKEIAEKSDFNIPCDNPKCQSKMKIFARYDDDYIKGVCSNPKCGMTIEIQGKEPEHLHQPENKKIGRNERCPCLSGKKYKKCCLLKGN